MQMAGRVHRCRPRTKTSRAETATPTQPGRKNAHGKRETLWPTKMTASRRMLQAHGMWTRTASTVICVATPLRASSAGTTIRAAALSFTNRRLTKKELSPRTPERVARSRPLVTMARRLLPKCPPRPTSSSRHRPSRRGMTSAPGLRPIDRRAAEARVAALGAGLQNR